MTREEVLSIKPGRELNCMVMEIVYRVKPSEKYGWFGEHPRSNAEGDEWQEADFVPNFSRKIEDAFDITNRMKQIELRRRANGKWACYYKHGGYPSEFEYVQAETLPEAICKAAILSRLEKSKPVCEYCEDKGYVVLHGDCGMNNDVADCPNCGKPSL